MKSMIKGSTSNGSNPGGGFFMPKWRRSDAEKAEAPLPYDRLSEPYGSTKLLLRDARENDAEAL